MKIIGFNGSPRKNGNTAWLINGVLKKAEIHGAKTEFWQSHDLHIGPCMSCYGCKKGEKQCILKDDMQNLYSSILSANAIILGSPIYMGQMSGQTKLFIDRLFAEFHPRFSPYFKEENAGKKLILIFTQGNPEKAHFQPYYDYLLSTFQKMEFDVITPIIIATGTRSIPVSENQEILPTLQKTIQSLLCKNKG